MANKKRTKEQAEENKQSLKDVAELQRIKDSIRVVADKYSDKGQVRIAGLLDAATACLEHAQLKIL